MKTPGSRIILLSGVSSSGKSSIARELQSSLDQPYLHVCIDSFEEMMPKARAKEGEFSTIPMLTKLLSGFHHSIATLASRGNNLIVDTVIIEGDEPANWLTECLELLTPYEVFFVGVRCDLEELERRETQRGDRWPGLSRWQFSRAHLKVVYDFEIDTSSMPSKECARQILESRSSSSFDGIKQTLLLNGLEPR